MKFIIAIFLVITVGSISTSALLGNLLESLTGAAGRTKLQKTSVSDSVKPGTVSGLVSDVLNTVNDVVTGGLTTVLRGLTNNLSPLPVDNIVKIDTQVIDAVDDALNAVFGQIKNAINAVVELVPEADGLVDVAVNNVEAAIRVLLKTVGYITSENLSLAGNVNGLGDHLNAVTIQLLATVQTTLDAIDYLAKNVELSAKIANVLVKIVAAIVSIANIVVSSEEGLLKVLVATPDTTDISGVVSGFLSGITSALKSDTGSLGVILSQLSGIDVSSENVAGKSVSGVLSGILSGVSGTLSVLIKSLNGLTGGISGAIHGLLKIVEVGVGSLSDLISGASKAGALSLVAGNVALFTDTLTRILSTLNAINL